MRSARFRFGIATCVVILLTSVAGSAAAATPGAKLWAKRFSADTAEAGFAVAASPDGTKVFATGYSGGFGETIAYDAVTGAKLWDASYDGPADFGAAFFEISASADGSKVFVAGYTSGATTGSDYATVAYDASSGSQIWDKTYAGPQSSTVFDDSIQDMAVLPDGTVVVTGISAGITDFDYATVAYAGDSGKRLWARRYDGPADGDDLAFGVAGSPDSSTVFVTGWSRSTSYDYATIAYDVSTGTKIWLKRFDGPGHFDDQASDIASAPDGSTVFVTGTSGKVTADFGTVAYDAATGAELWVRFYGDKVNEGEGAYSIGTSADGAAVFVSGDTEQGFATVAYDASSGARSWARNGIFGGASQGLAVSPDGTQVVITGSDAPYPRDRDYLAVSFSQSTGAKLWTSRYDGPADRQDNAWAIAIAPDSSAVYVTGQSRGLLGDDFATVAFAT